MYGKDKILMFRKLGEEEKKAAAKLAFRLSISEIWALKRHEKTKDRAVVMVWK